MNEYHLDIKEIQYFHMVPTMIFSTSSFIIGDGFWKIDCILTRDWQNCKAVVCWYIDIGYALLSFASMITWGKLCSFSFMKFLATSNGMNLQIAGSPQYGNTPLLVGYNTSHELHNFFFC